MSGPGISLECRTDLEPFRCPFEPFAASCPNKPAIGYGRLNRRSCASPRPPRRRRPGVSRGQALVLGKLTPKGVSTSQFVRHWQHCADARWLTGGEQGKPGNPAQIEKYLAGKFKDRLHDARAATAELAAVYEPGDLYRRGFPRRSSSGRAYQRANPAGVRWAN
jgi:hypothetical protein